MKMLAEHFYENSNIIRNKYNDQFHLNETIEYIYQNFYVTEWSLFRKYKSLKDYLSNENKAILSSKNGDTLEDLIEFIEKLESKRVNRWRYKYGQEI